MTFGAEVTLGTSPRPSDGVTASVVLTGNAVATSGLTGMTARIELSGNAVATSGLTARAVLATASRIGDAAIKRLQEKYGLSQDQADEIRQLFATSNHSDEATVAQAEQLASMILNAKAAGLDVGDGHLTGSADLEIVITASVTGVVSGSGGLSDPEPPMRLEELHEDLALLTRAVLSLPGVSSDAMQMLAIIMAAIAIVVGITYNR